LLAAAAFLLTQVGSSHRQRDGNALKNIIAMKKKGTKKSAKAVREFLFLQIPQPFATRPW